MNSDVLKKAKALKLVNLKYLFGLKKMNSKIYGFSLRDWL